VRDGRTTQAIRRRSTHRLPWLDLEATRATLRRHGHKFRENEVPGGRIHQIFVPDPDGIRSSSFRS